MHTVPHVIQSARSTVLFALICQQHPDILLHVTPYHSLGPATCPTPEASQSLTCRWIHLIKCGQQEQQDTGTTITQIMQGLSPGHTSLKQSLEYEVQFVQKLNKLVQPNHRNKQRNQIMGKEKCFSAFAPHMVQYLTTFTVGL